MYLRGRLKGQMTQGDSPDWDPLELVLGDVLPGWFMWMFEVRLDNGLILNAYKHHQTRQYLHLSRDGSAFRFCGNDSYLHVDLAQSIQEAFPDREVERLPPEQRLALEKALEEAQW